MDGKSLGQMEDKKSKEITTGLAVAIDSNDQYAASYLKTGSTSGVMYQVKLITWVTWKLMCQNDAKIDNWWLAAEVRNARGFHDLVLKYAINDTSKKDGDTSNRRYMYRFIQIKHKRSLMKHSVITSYHLLSDNKLHRQGSLIYLFKSYLNMLGSFEMITPDQIVDLTIFTNVNIEAFKFLVPVENDKLYGFEGKGKRYRIDIKALQQMPKIMTCLYNKLDQIKSNGTTLFKTMVASIKDDVVIYGFLRKLVFMVCQPCEHEMEQLIVADMSEILNPAQIFYDNLYKNIINWFLVYNAGKAPYLTKDHIMKHLKKIEETLLEAKKTEILVDSSVSKLSDNLKFLSM